MPQEHDESHGGNAGQIWCLFETYSGKSGKILANGQNFLC